MKGMTHQLEHEKKQSRQIAAKNECLRVMNLELNALSMSRPNTKCAAETTKMIVEGM